MQRASALFRLLGDATRLRLLRVLAQDRFNVTELTGILGVAQSGVSRHLGLLKDAGLVVEEREAGFVYYRLAREARHNGQAPLWPLLDAQFAAGADDQAVRQDEARLQEVLRLRKENFETHGDTRQLVPGRSWAAWARALGHLLPPLDVADIGCGDGYLTLEAARWARPSSASTARTSVLERAQGARGTPACHQRAVEEGRPGAPAAARRVDGRGAAVAGAASRQRSGARHGGSRAHPAPRRARARARPAGARPGLGAGPVRRSAPRLSTRQLETLLHDAGSRGFACRLARTRQATRSPFSSPVG